MVKHFCDSCGVEVTEKNGIVKTKEITLELNDKKISIAMEIDTMLRVNTLSDNNPALCSMCLAVRINDWAQAEKKVEEKIEEGGAPCQ